MVLAVKNTKEWLLIIASFLMALVLMFLHLPNWLMMWLDPQWLTLLVLYWVWNMPQRFSTSMIWLVGILLDILYNVPVGENALALVIAAYSVMQFKAKIVLLDFEKKVVVIFSIIVGCQLLPSGLQFILGRSSHFWPIFSRTIVGAIIWLIVVFWFNRQSKAYFENYY